MRERRPFEAQDLYHAARPTESLADMQAEPLGGQSGSKRQAQIGRSPSMLLHQERAVAVLGDGLLWDAAHLFERLAANDRAGSNT